MEFVKNTESEKTQLFETESEKNCYAKFIKTISSDELYKELNGKNLLQKLKDGVILCKLINQVSGTPQNPTIAIQAIKYPKKNQKNYRYESLENLTLAIQSAKSIGCQVVNTKAQLIFQGNVNITLGLIWQILNIYMEKHILLTKQIGALKLPDENVQQVFKLGYKKILIRWLNYHITLSHGYNKLVQNLGQDLSDSKAYWYLLSNIYKGQNEKLNLELDNLKNAQIIINACTNKYKIQTQVLPNNIISGNSKFNTILCFQIFRKKHGLISENNLQIINDPDTPQMKLYKNWINSLGIESVYITSFLNDLKSGIILGKLIKPCFNTDVFQTQNKKKQQKQKQEQKQLNKIKSIQNCSRVLEVIKGQVEKKKNYKFINIGGQDIYEPKQGKLVLSLIWQIFQSYWQNRFGKILKKEQIRDWVNQKVKIYCQKKKIPIQKSKQMQINNLNERDKFLRNKFLFYLIQSIKEDTIKFKYVKQIQQSKQSKQQIDKIITFNANYAISVGRSLGGNFYLQSQDLKECDKEHMTLFFGEFWHLDSMIKQKSEKQ